MTALTSFFADKCRSVRQDLTVLGIFFGAAFLQFLGRLPLIDPDEGRYAEIPREMLERGDFVTPLLNYVKYFEKPPLHYWLSAMSMTVFGENEFAARLPGAFMGLCCVLLVYIAGRRLFGRREGVLAALILGTSTGFLVQARIDITDMTLTFCLSAALCCFLLATREEEVRKGLFYHLFYVFAALAVLAKGLIGLVLPGGIIFFYLLLSGRWRLLREMRLANGILLFLLVAAPWFVLVSLRNPEFARFFFIHEHFERFLTKVHGRYQPLWFFVPVLAGTMLPWSFFIPASLRGIWKERRSSTEDSDRLFLAVWAVLIFLFFSKSNSKLIPYILPVFPPFALLMAYRFIRTDGVIDKGLRAAAWALATILTVVGIGAIAYSHLAPRPQLSGTAGLVIGSIFLVQGIMAITALRRNSLAGLLAGLVFCSYVLGIAGPPYILAGMAAKKSPKELGLAIKAAASPDAIVATFGLQQAVSFYAQRRVVIVGGMGEAEFGSQQGDQSAWFIDHDSFYRLWDTQRPVFAVLRQDELAVLSENVTAPVRVVAQMENKLLIANR
jgi:4-amino-4-deoxy-L-arabinose transferase-like glycosyltransferase